MENKVTVAIPVYNGERFILKALQSIAQQTSNVDKVLICDNKSTDGSLSIIKSFAKEHPELKIRTHVNASNIGSLPNFNKCMELCNTKYLLILAVDDRLKANAIEKLLRFYKQHADFGVVAGNVDLIDENDQLIPSSALPKKTVIFKKGQILELVEKTNLWIHPSAALYNMDCTRKIGFWDETCIGGDERYWAQILQQFPLAIIEDAITDQMVRKDQTGTLETFRFKDKIKHFDANLKVADFETDPERVKKTRKHIKKWIANQCIAISKRVFKSHGKSWLAIKYWCYGIKQDPGHFFNVYLYRIKRKSKKIFKLS